MKTIFIIRSYEFPHKIQTSCISIAAICVGREYYAEN